MPQEIKLILAETQIVTPEQSFPPGTHVATIIVEDNPGFPFSVNYLGSAIYRGKVVAAKVDAVDGRPPAHAKQIEKQQHEAAKLAASVGADGVVDE